MAEETVTQEAPSSIREHYEAAKAAAQSQDQGAAGETAETTSAETSDDTTGATEEQTAEPTDKAADQTEETAETEDALLPEDEVAKLTGDARAQYDRMNKAFTTKTQALSATRKEMERWQTLITALDADPDKTLEQLATARGFKLSKTEADRTGQDTGAAAQVKQETELALAELPEELKFLAPHFEAFAKRLTASIENKIKPIAESHQRMTSEAIQAQTETTLQSFSTKHPGWEKHEAKMLEVAKKIQPSAEMTELEYMELLFDQATKGLSEAEKTKKVIARMNKSAASAEPKGSGTPEKHVVHAMPPPERRGIREAYEAAKRGERWSQ